MNLFGFFPAAIDSDPLVRAQQFAALDLFFRKAYGKPISESNSRERRLRIWAGKIWTCALELDISPGGKGLIVSGYPSKSRSR
jgi:hypothetical protein